MAKGKRRKRKRKEKGSVGAIEPLGEVAADDASEPLAKVSADGATSEGAAVAPKPGTPTSAEAAEAVTAEPGGLFPPVPRWGLAVAAVVLALMAALPYLRSVGGDFYYDDWHYVVSGTDSKGARVSAQVNQPLGTVLRKRGQRAITFATYAIDHQLAGGGQYTSPLPFHITNLVLWVALVLALWAAWLAVIRRLGIPAFWPATFAAALFAAHPLLTELVNYPSARGSLLVPLFTYAGVAAGVGALRKGNAVRSAIGIILFAAFWFLAAYSKEIGAVVPLAILGGALFVTDTPWLRKVWSKSSLELRFAVLGGLVLIGVLFLVWLLHPAFEPLRPPGLNSASAKIVQKFQKSGTITDEVYGLGGPYHYTWVNFWWTEVRCMFRWLTLVLFPWGRQNIDHPVAWNEGLFDPFYTPILFLAYSALWVAAVLIPWKRDGLWRLVGLGLWITLCGILPNMVTPGLQPLLEYRFTTSLTGATLALGAGGILAGQYALTRGVDRRAVWGALGAVVLALLLGTYVRNGAWVNGRRLWEDSVEKEPTRLRAWNELAMAYYHTRYQDPARGEKAVEILKKIYEMNPRYVRGLSNLGAVLADFGRYDEAIHYLELMMKEPEAIDKGIIQLALLYEKQGDREKAISVWQRAKGKLLKGQQHVMALTSMLRLHMALGNEAKQAWGKAKGPERERLAKVMQQHYGAGAAAGEEFLKLFARHPDAAKVALSTANVLLANSAGAQAPQFLERGLRMAQRGGVLAEQRREPKTLLQAVVLEADGYRLLQRTAEAAARYEQGLAMLLGGQVNDPKLTMAVGGQALRMHQALHDTAAVRRVYGQIEAALPPPLKESFAKQFGYMKNVTFKKD